MFKKTILLMTISLFSIYQTIAMTDTLEQETVATDRAYAYGQVQAGIYVKNLQGIGYSLSIVTDHSEDRAALRDIVSLLLNGPEGNEDYEDVLACYRSYNLAIYEALRDINSHSLYQEALTKAFNKEEKDKIVKDYAFYKAVFYHAKMVTIEKNRSVTDLIKEFIEQVTKIKSYQS